MNKEKGEKIKAWRCSKCGGIYVDETCSCPIWSKTDKTIILVDINKIFKEVEMEINKHKHCQVFHAEIVEGEEITCLDAVLLKIKELKEAVKV
jgi:hypothetical protein